MFYISPQLTILMLAVVPPVSLGAVSRLSLVRIWCMTYVCIQVFYGRYLKKLSNKTQEALGDMTKVSANMSPASSSVSDWLYLHSLKVAQESLSALRTVQSFNAHKAEQEKFDERVGTVLSLARKEAVASGIFFGSTGWSGNVTLLALLAYGEHVCMIF